VLRDGTQVTDAQIHIWARSQRDDPAALGASRRILLVEDIVAEMDAAGVDHAILIPPSAAGDDNTAALEAAWRFPDRFAVMGRISLVDPSHAAKLADWRDQPGMLGVRLTLTRPQARRWLVDGTADWFWAAAEEFGIPLMVASGHDVAAMERLVAQYPGLRLVIDHMGLETTDRDEALATAVDALVPLARYRNLAVKASAIPTYLRAGFPLRGAMSQVTRLIEAYGPRRVFWGSDLSRLNTPYRDLVDVFVGQLDLSTDELALVMGGGLRWWLDWPARR
jgi:L-fuconolactonase